MPVRLRHIAVLFCSIFLIISCKTDNKVSYPPLKELETNELDGRWKMHEAYKEEQRTKLLDNAFFDFNAGETIATNILGDETPYPYVLGQNNLTVNGGRNGLYKVLAKTSDTLTLATKIRNFNFRFILVKSKDEE